MSSTPLSKIHSIVERSLHKAIQEECFDKGYAPNQYREVPANIVSISSGDNSFTVSGDLTDTLTKNCWLYVFGSDNHGVYRVSESATFNGTNTTVKVYESIPDDSDLTGAFSSYYYSNNSLGKTRWEADLKSARDSNPDKLAIEVFGVQDPDALGDKKIPRVVIVPKRTLPGALGGSPTKVYEITQGDVLSPEAYSEKQLPPQTAEFEYDVHIVTSRSAHHRIISSIVALALPLRGYVPFWDKQDDLLDRFFVEQYSFRNRPPTSGYNVREYIYLYRVTDIFEVESKTLRENVSPLKEVAIDINLEEPRGDTVTDTEEFEIK